MLSKLGERYLSLFSRTWNHSATRAPFAQLEREVRQAGERPLAELLAARMAAFDGHADQALEQIDALLARRPQFRLAELLKARILCFDRRHPEAALRIYRGFDTEASGRGFHGSWIRSLGETGCAGAYLKLKRFSRAVEGYAAVIARLARARTTELRLQLCRARLNKALGHLHLGDRSAAFAETDRLLRECSRSATTACDEFTARAILLQGLLRGADGLHAEALSAFDEVIRRFGGEASPEVKEVVLAAGVNRGIALRHLNHLTDSHRAFEEVIARSQAEEAVEIQEAAAMALIHKAEAALEHRAPRYWFRRSVPPHKEG